MKETTRACHGSSRLQRLVIAAFAASASHIASAQTTIHTVRPGDNLYDLAQRYLEDPAQWRLLQQINRVSDPRRMLPGSRLVIPDELARAQPVAAEVLHAAGPVVAQQEAAPTATPLKAGDRVDEGARIEVGEGGFATLRLADGSLVRLPAGTRARLRELRLAPASGHVQSRIQLERGRVDATVTPLPTPRSRFEIITPRAVGGVRGTTFGVALAPDGDLIGDVREGAIEVRSLVNAGAKGALVRAGQGARVGTRISVTRLLAPPDLSGLPSVLEDIDRIELPLALDAGATSWQVRMSSDEAAQHVVRNATFNQPLAQFAGLEDGSYHVSVRALDAQGVPGSEALRQVVVNARPQAPLLMAPREGSKVVAPDVELLCTETSGVSGYHFQLARDAAFAQLVAQTPDLERCRYSVRDLPPGAYTWRVAAVARDAKGVRDQGPFSPAVSFKVVSRPPTPAQPSLSENAVGTLSVTWGASPGGPWTHQIQLAHDPEFTRLLTDQQLTTPTLTFPTPSAGTYHIRVRQIDAHGLAGAWSAVQKLEIQPHVMTMDAQPLSSSDGRAVRPGAH